MTPKQLDITSLPFFAVPDKNQYCTIHTYSRYIFFSSFLSVPPQKIRHYWSTILFARNNGEIALLVHLCCLNQSGKATRSTKRFELQILITKSAKRQMATRGATNKPPLLCAIPVHRNTCTQPNGCTFCAFLPGVNSSRQQILWCSITSVLGRGDWPRRWGCTVYVLSLSPNSASAIRQLWKPIPSSRRRMP